VALRKSLCYKDLREEFPPIKIFSIQNGLVQKCTVKHFNTGLFGVCAMNVLPFLFSKGLNLKDKPEDVSSHQKCVMLQK